MLKKTKTTIVILQQTWIRQIDNDILTRCQDAFNIKVINYQNISSMPQMPCDKTKIVNGKSTSRVINRRFLSCFFLYQRF